MNNLLFFVTAIVTFGLLTFVVRKFGKEGVFAWVGFAVVVANILVCKCVDFLGMSATLGNVLFGSVFLCTDVLTELYGAKTAKKAVWVGVSISVISLVLLQIGLMFQPNELDVVNDSLRTLFGLYPRTALASISMFVFSNQLDIYLFDMIKQKTKGKYLALRNNVATCVSQCLENFFFYCIAFLGVYSMPDILMMTSTCCVIEIIVALLDTPFLYLALYKHPDKQFE